MRKTQPSVDAHTGAESLSNPHLDFPSTSSGEPSTLSRTSVPGRNDACSNVDGMSGALFIKVGTINTSDIASTVSKTDAMDSNNKQVITVCLAKHASLSTTAYY